MPKLHLRAPDRRCLLAMALAFALATPFGARAQAAFDLAQLTQLLSQVKSSEATFTEKRQVDMLERTLESSGRLSFTAPDSFTRETLKPRREKISVVGNDVTMSQGGRSRTVPLDSVPEAAIIVEAIRGTLMGNRELLVQHFEATVGGNTQRWTLELVPREPRLRELVRTVVLGGKQSLVLEVTVIMADGDRSVMQITPVVSSAMPASAGK